MCIRKCGKFDRTKPEESGVRHEVFVHGQILKRNLVKKKEIYVSREIYTVQSKSFRTAFLKIEDM